MEGRGFTGRRGHKGRQRSRHFKNKPQITLMSEQISWRGGTGQRRRHRGGRRGGVARQEAAGRVSTGGGLCGVELGGAAGGKEYGGPRQKWAGQSCSQLHCASRPQGARRGGVAGAGHDVGCGHSTR